MDEDALQIYHDPKAHRDDLRAVIDSQEIEIARLRTELAWAANSDPTEPLPIRYRERTYGTTNISRWKHGLLLLRMVAFAARRIKFV